MNEIFDLYQELIIDHARSPKNFGILPEKSHYAQGHNPLCGDIIHLEILLIDNVIARIAFSGDGCAISKASASLMTESIKNRTVEQAHQIFESFHRMLTRDDDDIPSLGKLAVFLGVKQFPVRIKCATLCWHTLNAALKKEAQSVTTE